MSVCGLCLKIDCHCAPRPPRPPQPPAASKQDEILAELRLIVDNLQQLNENMRSVLTYGIRQSK